MKKAVLLPKVAKNPALIKTLSPQQLVLLSAEIRAYMVETVSRTGGHLAPGLGCVELTIALMRVLDVPQDKIVWDVGHQCYAYKMLTGRYEQMPTLRQEGGISGFPKTAESEYDSFVAGHASTSLAAAYGLRRAMMHAGDEGHTVAAVVGDGAFTGGMVYEGLNNIGKSKENLIVVLNDNEMAISRNEGALAKYLSVLRAKPGYFRFKDATEKTLLKIPLVGDSLRDIAAGGKAYLKHAIYPETFFEEFGFTYFGPVDGHDISMLCSVLEQARRCEGPAFVHVKTQKGKGYAPAQENPGKFHGVGKFDIETGKTSAAKETFSSVFGSELLRLAKQDERIIAVTAAMEHGTGLQDFAREFKSAGRYYDVGIAEEFATTFCAAAAAGGRLPVFAVYSTFLQRGYDQLLHDVALEPRHVVFCVDRAGIVGDDGETHQGIFDTAYLSTVPGMTVFAPANYNELRYMLGDAVKNYDTPVAIRYPRGSEDDTLSDYPASGNSFDMIKTPGASVLLVTYGRTFAAARAAAEQCPFAVDILKINRITPLDDTAVAAAARYDNVFFAEEGILSGGIGMQFLAKLSLAGACCKTHLRAIEGYVPQSTVPAALHKLGLDAEGLSAWMKEGCI